MVNTLIADDFKKWHDVVERNLIYFGFNNFLHTYTISEGLILYLAHKPELVITDVNFDSENLENLDGLILCEEVRKQNKDTKIVVMSSNINHEEAAMIKGANYFIQKPLFKDQIEDFIRKNYNIIK